MPITLSAIRLETAKIRVIGTAPLIVHAWSKKAKEMMLAAQQNKKIAKTPKNPQEAFEESRYKFGDGTGDGFPTMAFKAATVKGGARAFGKAVRMTELRQCLIFLPDGFGADATMLTKLHADPPIMREDMVRVGMGVADLRYRACYNSWEAELTIKFQPNVIAWESVVALVDAGGQNGIGEWRPEKNGAFGTYTIAQ